MMKNFSAQPDGGGQIDILTANDLQFDVQPSNNIFMSHPNFIDNCTDCKSFANAEGDDPVGYWIKYGIDTGLSFYNTEKAQQQAQTALEIEQQKKAQAEEAARLEALKAETESVKNQKLKSVVLPIAVVGIVGIVGIASYFYFKKNA
jgi:hypothetical protein